MTETGTTKLEICIESIAGARHAIAGGADRLEVCGALDLGGITPPPALIQLCCELESVRSMVMIRPRPGSFVYDDNELELMERDVEFCCESGADGVVVGPITADRCIDIIALQRLIIAARPMEVTFHRAFDLLCDQDVGLGQLIELGVDRVLTSGAEVSAWDGREQIQRLVHLAGDRISVMPGAGVTAENVTPLLSATGAGEVHASCRRSLPPTAPPSVDSKLVEHLSARTKRECDPACVRSIRRALDAAGD